MKLKMPCGVELAKNFFSRHVKKCEKCSKVYQEFKTSDIYNDIIQSIVDKTDYHLPYILKELKDVLPIPITETKEFRDIIDYKIKKYNLYPTNYKHECICGARFIDSKRFGAHKGICPKIKEVLNNIIEKCTLSFLKEELENKGKFLRTLIYEILPKEYHEVMFTSVSHKLEEIVQDYVRSGKLKYIPPKPSEVMNNKYAKQKHLETVMEKYGVDNVSKLKNVQKKKEETFLRKYGVRHLQQSKEIREKSLRTLQEKYGVTNISQVETIKNKKKQTFQKHYGVDNIFQHTDMMVKSWIDKLGVPNPVYIRNNLLSFVRRNCNAYRTKVAGKEFVFLSDIEEYVVRKIYSWSVEYKFDKIVENILVNNDVLYKISEDKQDVLSWVPDIVINKFCLEIKSNVPILQTDIDRYVKLCDFNNKRLMIYFRDNATKLSLVFVKSLNKSCFIIDKNQSNKIKYVFNNVINCLRKYFQNIEDYYVVNNTNDPPLFYVLNLISDHI